MENQEKYNEYTKILYNHLVELLNPENDIHITAEELNKDDNMNHFIHAMASLAPALIFNQMTNNKESVLDFNHVANKLCFQFLPKPTKDEG